MIEITDKIGMIEKYQKNDCYRYHEEEITRINTTKKGTKIYSKRYYPIDLEELESNTRILNKKPGILLVQEPFVTNEELAERCKRWCEYTNEHGLIDF